MALVLALGIMAVLAISATVAIDYTTSNAHTSAYSKGSQIAYTLAEAGVNNALSILTNSAAPTTSTLLPSTTITLTGGTATYSGALNGTVWTITSTGYVRSPASASKITRRITRQVDINGLDVGSLGPLWDRIYNDDNTGCFTLYSPVVIPSPFAARGNICTNGATAKFTGARVDVGGTTSLTTGTSIGVSGTNIGVFAGSNSCNYNLVGYPSPCSATAHVYANSYTGSPQNLVKPTVNFAYWYQNASPGPMHPCTGADKVGTVPTFDNNATYDGSLSGPISWGSTGAAGQEITPEPGVTLGTVAGSAVNYTCRTRDAQGNIIGELSWNRTTRVLTVNGTIFFDGDAMFHDHDQATWHYYGRGTIWIAGNWHNDEPVCAGGTATNNCRTTGMSSWNPATDLLVIISGDKLAAGTDWDFHRTNSAFQGVLFATHDCKIRESAYVSGPVICNKILFDATGTPQFFAWPPLPGATAGQLYGNGSASDLQLVLGQQTG